MSKLLVAIALILTCSSTAHANALPEDQRTNDTARWLAVAFVAEAGWAPPRKPEAEADHRAVYHVLKRRWSFRVERGYKRPFVYMVQHYIAAFDPRTEKAGRVRWLLSLSTGEDHTPVGWPVKLSWEAHKPFWLAAQARAHRCIAGKCADPYKGKALHWGSDHDRPTTCMVLLPNAGTLNRFYAVDTKCTRRVRRNRAKGRASVNSS